jgi:hypothetical protein
VSHVSRSHVRTQLRYPLQEVRGEHPGARRDPTRSANRSEVPTLRGAQTIPAVRSLSRQALLPAREEAILHSRRVNDGIGD